MYLVSPYILFRAGRGDGFQGGYGRGSFGPPSGEDYYHHQGGAGVPPPPSSGGDGPLQTGTPAPKRTRSPSLSEDSDENIPKAYRLRRRSVSPSGAHVSPDKGAPLTPQQPGVKKMSVVRRSFSRSPGRDSSPSRSPQRFNRTAVERSEGPLKTGKTCYYWGLLLRFLKL